MGPTYHTTIVAFAIGVLATTILYLAWMINGSAALRRATTSAAMLTVLVATMMAFSVDTDDCYPSETTDSMGRSSQYHC